MVYMEMRMPEAGTGRLACSGLRALISFRKKPAGRLLLESLPKILPPKERCYTRCVHSIGEHVELEVTQIGKKCYGDNCSIFREVGNCVMPKEGIFARVLKGGHLQGGDVLNYHPRVFRALIITLSDRASKGEYEDKSGPLLAKLLTDFFTQEKRKLEVETIVIPDEAPVLHYRLQEARETGIDMVFTTGGTGIGPRDITPDVVTQMLDKELPGVMEMIRLKYGAEKPNALLSRGVAGLMGRTLIFTLPGSPKAVNEYCTEIFRILNHAFLMLAGIDGH